MLYHPTANGSPVCTRLRAVGPVPWLLLTRLTVAYRFPSVDHLAFRNGRPMENTCTFLSLMDSRPQVRWVAHTYCAHGGQPCFPTCRPEDSIPRQRWPCSQECA